MFDSFFFHLFFRLKLKDVNEDVEKNILDINDAVSIFKIVVVEKIYLYSAKIRSNQFHALFGCLL